jgi:hypothetical protein
MFETTKKGFQIIIQNKSSYRKMLTKLHSGSNSESRNNQVVTLKWRLASLMFCWFIQAVTVPATQVAAIPHQQKYKHSNIP